MKTIAIIENTGADFFNSRIRFAYFLKKKGCTVTAIVPNDGFVDKIKNIGFEVLVVGENIRGKGLINKLNFAIVIYKILSKNSFDIVHCFRMQPNIVGGFIGGILNLNVFNHITGLGILFTRTSLKYRLQKFIIKFCYQFNNRFFKTKYIFQNETDVFDLGITKHYRVIRGSTANEDVFYPNNKFSNSLLNKLKIKKGEKIILFVSRLIKSKGLDILVSSVKNINCKSGSNYRLLVVGWIDTQNIDSYNQIEIENFKKYDFVTFLGKRNDVNDLINFTDICVLPTTYREGTPRFLLEAMACAKPIITTNMPGCSHLVNNSKPNGFIVNPLNEKNLSEALLQLFASDLKLYGENSRLLYLEKFSEKVIFDLIYNFYNY